MELEGREEKNGGLDFERHMTCMYEFCKQFLKNVSVRMLCLIKSLF